MKPPSRDDLIAGYADRDANKERGFEVASIRQFMRLINCSSEDIEKAEREEATCEWFNTLFPCFPFLLSSKKFRKIVDFNELLIRPTKTELWGYYADIASGAGWPDSKRNFALLFNVPDSGKRWVAHNDYYGATENRGFGNADYLIACRFAGKPPMIIEQLATFAVLCEERLGNI